MSKTFSLSDSSVVVVIGSGAGGGTLGHELARQGIDVVCLEAGPRQEASEFVNDAEEMTARLTWLDRRIGVGDTDANFPVFTCKTVGGTTVHWTATALRMQDHELRPQTTYGKIENTSLIDWPLSPEELAPYYDRAEDKMGVTGTHGIPRLPESNHYKVLKAGAKRVGYQHFNTGNMAINSEDRDGRPACRQIGFCMSGCVIAAKWSTLYTEIPRAEDTGHFELRPQAMAVRINHDADGRVAGVVYIDKDGVRREQKARAVCVAGNAIETARLLLNSKSDLFPSGLANRSDQVGRHYMRHVFAGVAAIMPGPVNFHRGTQQAGHVQDEADHRPERGFSGGYQIEILPFPPTSLARLVSPGGWGDDFAAIMEKYNHFASLLIQGEDFPQADNRILLHGEERDAYGLPLPVVRYRDHANNVALRRHGVAAARKIFQSLGAERIFTYPLKSATHNMGACRMSARPQDGVCDRWGRAHDIRNLYISDGSAFSSSSSANPTLTIVALAIRQAEHIAKEISAGRM